MWTIIVADLVMSLDNVMAVAAAAKGNLPLIVFGLVISIPLVIFGSQIIMRLIERFPLLVLAGGGLLGYIAGDMAIDDPVVAPWIEAHVPMVDWLAPLVGIAVVVASRAVAGAPSPARRVSRRARSRRVLSSRLEARRSVNSPPMNTVMALRLRRRLRPLFPAAS